MSLLMNKKRVRQHILFTTIYKDDYQEMPGLSDKTVQNVICSILELFYHVIGFELTLALFNFSLL